MATCYYCGLPAESVDHVVPQSVINQAILSGNTEAYLDLIGRGRILIVDCCRQCNSILGNINDKTLAERKARLKTRLKIKLNKDLTMPDWNEQELETLSPTLRSWVQEGLIRREIARGRIGY